MAYFYSVGGNHRMTASQSKSFDSTGGIGGGQIGYNVQNGTLVFGVEADLARFGISGTNYKHPYDLGIQLRHQHGKGKGRA